MIRLRPFEKMSYKEIRKEYLEQLVKHNAVEFDEADVLDDDSRKKDGKSKNSYDTLEDFPELRDYLYIDKDNMIREHLRQILIGPNEAPRSLGGEGEFATMRSVFEKIILGIEGRKLNIITSAAVSACKKIFKYEQLNVVSKELNPAYWLQSQLCVKVCPYCNRMYTTTLYGKKRVRPDFDHFYPQSRYPYFAVSLFNLIPSCNVCNKAKSDYAEIKSDYVKIKDGFEKKNEKEILYKRQRKSIIYPYDESYNELQKNISFRVIPDKKYQEVLVGQSDEFTVELRPTKSEKLKFKNSVLTKTELNERFTCTTKTKIAVEEKKAVEEELAFWNRAKHSIDLLRLESLYNEHKSEIMKILRIHYEYNQDAKQLIMQTLNSSIAVHADLLPDSDLQYFAYLKQEEWGNSPLNKLKSDILEQLEEIEKTCIDSTKRKRNENDEQRNPDNPRGCVAM